MTGTGGEEGRLCEGGVGCCESMGVLEVLASRRGRGRGCGEKSLVLPGPHLGRVGQVVLP